MMKSDSTHGHSRSVRPGSRAAPRLLMCAAALLLGGIGLIAAAWVLGGREAGGPPPSVQSVLPQDERTTSEDPDERIPVAPQLHEAWQGCGSECRDGHWSDTDEPLTVHALTDDELGELTALGWNIPRFPGLGMSVAAAETTYSDGVRTVEVRHTDGEHDLTIAEMRTEDEDEELPSLQASLDAATSGPEVDVDAARLSLSTGEQGVLYSAPQGGSWTAVVDGGTVEYVVTSDLTDDDAQRIADWVMVTDRARIETMPDSPSGTDRIGRGLQDMMFWRED